MHIPSVDEENIGEEIEKAKTISRLPFVPIVLNGMKSLAILCND
jgi:hypothetical protein